MAVLLIAACGKEQETDSGITYFHHSIADERNTQETERQAEELTGIPLCGRNGIPLLLWNGNPFL